jgi:hypothetical protein
MPKAAPQLSEPSLSAEKMGAPDGKNRYAILNVSETANLEF